MEKKQFPCPACSRTKEKEVLMIEKYDLLVCPECQTSFILTGKSPLGRYADDWKRNADEVFPLVRPEMNLADLPIPRLFFLYEDCYHTLLIGRYNASIVLMGVLLEALMKERIRLKLGIEFQHPYGPCLKKIEKERLMDAKDIQFLRTFKDKIRNPYQHADEYKILQGCFAKVWPFKIEGELTFEKIEQFMKDVTAGKLKPKLLPAADIPSIRSVVKQSFDRVRAIELFNQIFDFLIEANARYFKQEEYDEHHKKFRTSLENIEYYRV